MAEFKYYESRKAKWVVAVFTLITTILMFPIVYNNPAPFILWVVLSGTLTVLVWTRKQSKEPKVTFNKTTIKTDRGDIFYVSTISKVELKKSPPWLKNAPICLVLYFKEIDGTASIVVSGLNSSPEEILSKLKPLLTR